jgi:hypothetical protein
MTCTADAAPARRRRWWQPLAGAALALLAVGPAVADGPAVDAVRAKARAALARRDPISAEVALREALRQGAPADALRADLAAALLARGRAAMPMPCSMARWGSRPIPPRWAGACAASWPWPKGACPRRARP